jgi:hypothetical protein
VLTFKVLRSFLALGGGSIGQIMKICLKDYVSFLQIKPYLGPPKCSSAPYRVKIKSVKTHGLWHGKEQARPYGFNAKIDKSNGPL